MLLLWAIGAFIKRSHKPPRKEVTNQIVEYLDPVFAQNILRVERRVMKKLFWSHDPVMSSVYPSEEWVLHLKDDVGVALDRAIAPAAEYLTTLDPFLEFLNVDGESRRQ